jgi:hypothetical protein
LVFWWSEHHHNRGIRQEGLSDQDKFRLEEHSDVSLTDLHVRPGNVLIDIRNPGRLQHVERSVAEVNPQKQDAVGVVVHRLSRMASAEDELNADQICSDREIKLLSKVVTVAEKAGKHIELLVVPAKDPYCALVHVAQKLQSSCIVERRSPKVKPEDEAWQVGRAWERLPEPRPALTLEVVPGNNSEPAMFTLGPHPPQLWPTDIDLVYRLWRELTERYGFGPQLHHRDVVGVALRRFDLQLHSRHIAEVLEDVHCEVASKEDAHPAR